MTINKNLLISGYQEYVSEDIISDIFDSCYNVIGISQNNVVSIAFCSSNELKSLNLKYRGVDNYTDVLSFSSDNGSGIYKSDNDGFIFLGEILIDVNYIENQNSSDKVKIEIIKVIVHGFLHLLGFDHLNNAQKAIMQEMEKRIYSVIEQEK